MNNFDKKFYFKIHIKISSNKICFSFQSKGLFETCRNIKSLIVSFFRSDPLNLKV